MRHSLIVLCLLTLASRIPAATPNPPSAIPMTLRVIDGDLWLGLKIVSNPAGSQTSEAPRAMLLEAAKLRSPNARHDP